MIKAVLLFLIGMVLLIRGGDWFVDGAQCLAERLHIPELIIGATVVSIGTTLPEVMVSATSALTGHGEIAYGNAIGSVICNTALIAAISIAVKPGEVDKGPFKKLIWFFFAAAAIYFVFAYGFGEFSRLSGILLLLLFAAYMTVAVLENVGRELPPHINPEDIPNDIEEILPPPEKKQLSAGMTALCLIAGAAAIAIGADLLVDNGSIIALAIGVPEAVVALTFIALGTSLPELVTAITSLIRGHGALSLGNILGANLFNLVLVSGLSSALSPFTLPVENVIAGVNASLVVDLPVMLGVMLLLTLPALIKGRLYRCQGIALLAIYFGFCIYQFVI